VNDRIVTYIDGSDMVILRCRKHPDKRWWTKNIAFIGARSIFYNLFDDPDMGHECLCPGSLLEPLTVDEYWETKLSQESRWHQTKF